MTNPETVATGTVVSIQYTLRLEDEFNRAAGFTVDDDELPNFFYDEELPPTNKAARFHAEEVRKSVERWWAQSA